MLTPGYSPTATERVLPRLALDFTTASLDSRVTVTRALNTATRFNSSGFLETVNANLPRFDYTLNTGGACKGLLIEDTKQNICLYSTDLTAVSWNTYGDGTIVAANSGISIDGTNNAFKVTSAGGLSRLGQSVTVSSSTTYTFSFYAKNVDATVVTYFDTATGTSTNYVSQINTSTWTRISKTVTTGAAATSLIVQFTRDIPSGQSVLICCPQIEANSFASSVILTSATAVTRNADAVSMTGTNFSNWFNASEGAFVVNYSGGIVGSYALASSDGTGNNYYGVVLHNATTIRNVAVASGAYQFVSNTVTSASATNKTSYSYKTNSVAAATNGGTVATNASVTLPTVDRLIIGAFGGFAFLNGYVRTISYYPQRLINAENQAFSK